MQTKTEDQQVNLSEESQKCSVCDICCTWKYCSLECYKIHKSTNNQLISSDKTGVCGGPKILSAEERAYIECSKKVGHNKAQYKILEQQYTEELGALTEQDKQKIKNDPRIRKAIDTLAYRNSIRQIVNAPNSIDQLARYMVNPEFNVFITNLQELLDENFMPLEPTPTQTFVEQLKEKLLLSD